MSLLLLRRRPCTNSLASHLRRAFNVLAFESSADDTCAAVVTLSGQILSNVVHKQHALHESYGGIMPYAAVLAHRRDMPDALRDALGQAKLDMNAIDGIAFTRGPGMLSCLGVGATTAKTLAVALNKPLVGVHHMQAHALTALLTIPRTSPSYPSFPFLTLLVSGGHTLLLLCTAPSVFRTLATTHDVSVGRAFDKVARMLGLPWGREGPGAALEAFCAEADHGGKPDPAMPDVLRGRLEFSYAGLVSAVQRHLDEAKGALDVSARRAIARAFQTAAVAQLEEKLALGLRWCEKRGVGVRHVVVSGGVARNTFLRERLQQCVAQFGEAGAPIRLAVPDPALCTDNAAMIAWASMPRFLAGDYDDHRIDVRPKWDIEELAVPDLTLTDKSIQDLVTDQSERRRAADALPYEKNTKSIIHT